MVVSHSLFMTSWNEWLEDAMIFSSSQCGESDRQAVGSLSVMPRVHSYMALFRAEAVGCWMLDGLCFTIYDYEGMRTCPLDPTPTTPAPT